jgi:hypothetical protein
MQAESQRGPASRGPISDAQRPNSHKGLEKSNGACAQAAAMEAVAAALRIRVALNMMLHLPVGA